MKKKILWLSDHGVFFFGNEASSGILLEVSENRTKRTNIVGGFLANTNQKVLKVLILGSEVLLSWLFFSFVHFLRTFIVFQDFFCCVFVATGPLPLPSTPPPSAQASPGIRECTECGIVERLGSQLFLGKSEWHSSTFLSLWSLFFFKFFYLHFRNGPSRLQNVHF